MAVDESANKNYDFEKYSDEDVTMVLEDGTEVSGMTSNEDDDITAVEYTVTVTFKGAGGPMDIQQVAVQDWDGDQIVRKRFTVHKTNRQTSCV